MLKKGFVYIIIGIITLVFLLVIQYNKPKEINWFPSYVSQHKIPYGTFVLNDIMSKFFDDDIQEIALPPFEFLKDNESTIKATYFFVNNNISFGEAELNSLLNWTSKGNTLFIASETFEEQLLDTLHLKTETLYNDSGLEYNFYHDLVNPNLKLEKSILFKKQYNTTYFNKIDTLKTNVLGVVYNKSSITNRDEKQISIIEQNFGNGKIILSSFPKAFTNYFILKKNNKNYTAGLLSYLNTSTSVFIDTHYKSGKKFYTSPMYIFLNKKELKWAYYILLIGALLYVIFEGKRKQRAIPVVVPLKNQTLSFTRTIANMYYEKGEQKQIIKHKLNSFLDYIRSRFYLSTQNINDEFLQNLASRSNHTLKEIKDIFTYINKVENKQQTTDEDLIKLNSIVAKFKMKANGK